MLSRKRWFHSRIHVPIVPPLSPLVLTRTCHSLPIKPSKEESRRTKRYVGSMNKLMLSYAYASFPQHLVCIGYKKESFSRI